MKSKLLLTLFLLLLVSGGGSSGKLVEASSIDKLSINEVNEIVNDIRLNTSEVDFQELVTKYNDTEAVISTIGKEVSETLSNFTQELVIDLDSNQQSSSQIETFNLVTESGYHFTVTSEVTSEPSISTFASTTITGNYDSTFSHTVSVNALGGLAGTSTLTTKIKVSPGKISYVSSTPKCTGVGLVYCDQGLKDSWGAAYTMSGTYSSFQTKGTFVYKGDFSILGSAAYTHNVSVKYGCTAYNGTTKKVTIKVQY